jgi:hypothetical protein
MKGRYVRERAVLHCSKPPIFYICHTILTIVNVVRLKTMIADLFKYVIIIK